MLIFLFHSSGVNDKEGPFKPEYFYVPFNPFSQKIPWSYYDEVYLVEYGVVYISVDGKAVVMPSKVLTDLTLKQKQKIGDRLGGFVVHVEAKPSLFPTTTTSINPTRLPTSKTQKTNKQGQSTGAIAGIIVAAAIAAIVVAINIWRYYR